MIHTHVIDQQKLYFIRAIFHESTVLGTGLSNFTVE
ncbi:RAxF-45 family protein [Halobacillus rhizosphaerae]